MKNVFNLMGMLLLFSVLVYGGSDTLWTPSGLLDKRESGFIFKLVTGR